MTAAANSESSSRASGMLDGVVPRTLITLALIAAGWLALSGVHAMAGFIGPTLLALNLFIVVYPVQQWLVRHHVHPVLGVIVSTLLALLVMVIFLGALIWALTSFVTALPEYQPQFLTLYRQVVDWLGQFGVSSSSLESSIQDMVSPDQIAQLAGTALGSLNALASPIILTVTIVFVIVIDSITYPARMKRLADQRPVLRDALSGFVQGVRRYWVVSSVFGLIVAIVDVAALLMLGVPLAGVWGLLSFLTNYIPNIGFILGLIPPVLMALLANDPMTALWVAVIYSVANFIIQSVIQPKFNGQAVGVTATVSLLSLFIWSYALGALGALLALPTTLLVKAVFIDVDPQLRWLNIFVADDIDEAPTEPPPADGDLATPATVEGPTRESTSDASGGQSTGTTAPEDADKPDAEPDAEPLDGSVEPVAGRDGATSVENAGNRGAPGEPAI